MNYTTFVGLDVHKEKISVAVADKGTAEPRFIGTIRNTPEDIAKLVRKLSSSKKKKKMLFCYEAGPCGYQIYRQLKNDFKIECIVVAPSLIPQRPGERIKTDKRDAKKLARLLRSGELTAVWVPDEEHETLRELVRAREDAQQDVMRKRHQLSKFLLRHNLRPPKGVRAWTVKHRQWMESLKFKQPAQGVILKEYLHALDQAQEMVKRLEREIAELAKHSKQAPVINAIQSLRGVALITAATVVAEAGDITRFQFAKQIMSYPE